MTRLGIRLFALICALAALAWLSGRLMPAISDTTLRYSGGRTEHVELPLEMISPSDYGHYTFTAKISSGSWSYGTIRLITDDCIDRVSINGENYDLSAFPRHQLCNIGRGVPINLKPHLHDGDNAFAVDFTDLGGGLAVRLTPDPHDPLDASITLAMLALALAAAALVVGELGHSRLTTAILVGALLVRLVYFEYTGFSDRSHDFGDHLDYVKLVADRHRIPQLEDCTECHQPPLYYVAAATILEAARKVHSPIPYSSLQLFSLFGFFVFLVITARFLESLVDDPRRRALALALICFWPSGVLHSIRIGNDAYLYLFLTASLLWLHRWWKEGAAHVRPLHVAALFGLAAMLVKLSGLICFEILGVVLAFALFRSPDRRAFLRRHATIALPVAVAAGLAAFFGPRSYQNFKEFGVATQTLRLSTGPSSFVGFDPKAFFTMPFINGLEDRLGRQYFWNFFLKTSLFGEWSVRAAPHETLALVLSSLFAVLLATGLFGLLRSRRTELEKRLVPGVAALFLVVTLMAYRYRFPIAANSDFRFVLPILIPFAAFHADGTAWLSRSRIPIASRVAEIASLLFIVLAIVFFVSPLFYAVFPEWKV